MPCALAIFFMFVHAVSLCDPIASTYVTEKKQFEELTTKLALRAVAGSIREFFLFQSRVS